MSVSDLGNVPVDGDGVLRAESLIVLWLPADTRLPMPTEQPCPEGKWQKVDGEVELKWAIDKKEGFIAEYSGEAFATALSLCEGTLGKLGLELLQRFERQKKEEEEENDKGWDL